MAKNKESAQERNARIRREQQRISEERSRRSLREEDFQFGADEMDSVRLKHINENMEKNRNMQSQRTGMRSEVKERKPHRPSVSSSSNVKKHEKPKRREAEPVKQDRAGIRKEKRSLMSSPAITLDIRHESNFSLIACIVLLCFIGLVMVTSSSYYHAFHNMDGDSFFFAKKQMIFLLAGAVAMVVAAYAISIKLIKRLSWLAYAVSVALTILVLFIGKEVNGSTRWIVIGPIQFQPAEFAKLGVALFMAVKVEQYQKSITSFRTFCILMLILLIPTGFVAVKNLSSALIIAVIGLVIMFVGGCRFKYFMILAAGAAIFFVIFVVLPALVPLEAFPKFMHGVLEEFMYRSNRIEAFLDPFKYAQGTGYQTVQSLYAIGSGGLFGVGLGESVQKLGFIPEAYNDIIFAVICEELGLIGATIVILLFGILVKQGIHVAMDAPDRYTTYVAAGLTAQVGIQAIMNVAVNTNTIPATGATLPFISYGGTAMILLMGSMGILLNISRYTKSTGSNPASSE